MLIGGTPLLLILLAGGLGWFGPDVCVSRAGRLRQERIERDLPDFLDILAVTVRAGLGYRLALARVVRGARRARSARRCWSRCARWSSARAAASAFEALRDRNASEQLSSFVAAQLQAEELGVPLSEALNDIAADMRRAAHQAARRRAARAAPRVSLVVTSLIVPGTMILIVVAICPRLGPPGRRAPVTNRERAGSSERGPSGSGGWLESACKLIVAIRAGLLLVTMSRASARERRRSCA